MKRSETPVIVSRFESHAGNRTWVRWAAHIVAMAGQQTIVTSGPRTLTFGS
jgi:hypothetical protein